MNKRYSRGLVATAAVAGALVVGAVSAAPAQAGKLPGAVKTKNFDDGALTIRLYDESSRITKAVTSTPLSREVFVSGKVAVTTAGDVKGGNINAGYIVGCQVNFGADMGAKGGIEQGFPDAGGTVPDAKPSLEGTGGISLAPGKAAYFPVISQTIDKEDVNSFDFKNARGGVVYSNERFGVDGCAGYAQARAMVRVKVKTPTFKGNVTLYGKPFSIG